MLGAMGTGVIWGCLEYQDRNIMPLWALPIWLAFGAFVGGLVEWQLDDDDDEVDPLPQEFE